MRRNLVAVVVILTLTALCCRIIQPSGPNSKKSLESDLMEALDRLWGPGRTESVVMKDGVVRISMRMGQETRLAQREWTYDLARFMVSGRRSVRDIRVDFTLMPPPGGPVYDYEPWSDENWEWAKSEALRKKCQRELDCAGFRGRALVLVDAIRKCPERVGPHAWLPNVLPPEENPTRYGLLGPVEVSDSRESERLEVRLVGRLAKPEEWLGAAAVMGESLKFGHQKGDNWDCVSLP